MAAIQSVQNGSLLVDSADTAAITEVDLTKATLIVTQRNNVGANDRMLARGWFSSSTELTFDRGDSLGGDTTVDWWVIEWSSGVSVQSGSDTGNAGDVTISSVTVDDAYVTHTLTVPVHQGINQHYGVKATITGSTTLNLSTASANDATVEWFVVESSDFVVQDGVISYGVSVSEDVTITAVDLTKTFPVLSWLIDNSANADEFTFRGHFTSTTNLRIERNASDGASPGTDGMAWQVVELSDDSTVQSGTFAFVDTDAQESATVTSVDTVRTSPTTSGYVSASGDNDDGAATRLDRAMVTLDLTSSTNLQADRGNSDGALNVEWFLVEWAEGTSGVTGSAAITEPVDTVSASGAVLISGTAGITEPVDSVTSSGSVLISGSAGIAEPVDVVDASGSTTDSTTGSAAITEPVDDVSGTGSVLVSGTASISEPVDVVAASGTVSSDTITGTASIAEPVDVVSGVGGVTVTGTAGITEPVDLISASGGVLVSGSAAITEPVDSVSGTGGEPTDHIEGNTFAFFTDHGASTADFTDRGFATAALEESKGEAS